VPARRIVIGHSCSSTSFAYHHGIVRQDPILVSTRSAWKPCCPTRCAWTACSSSFMRDGPRVS
jgi:hypothetical protein